MYWEVVPLWRAKTMPVKKLVITVTGRESTPMRNAWMRAWRHSSVALNNQRPDCRTMRVAMPRSSMTERNLDPTACADHSSIPDG